LLNDSPPMLLSALQTLEQPVKNFAQFRQVGIQNFLTGFFGKASFKYGSEVLRNIVYVTGIVNVNKPKAQRGRINTPQIDAMVRKGRYRSVEFMTNLHIEVADFIFADLFLPPKLEHLLQLFRGV